MYRIGDNVLYGSHGICQIVDMEERILDRKKVSYFVLVPLEQSRARFLIPSQNPAVMAKLCPIMTKEELDALLHSPNVIQDGWIDDENQRKQCYKALITGGDRSSLLRMVYTLYRHRRSLEKTGRKLHLCDENFLRDAQKLLESEFSLVLGIARDEVADYVIKQLGSC